MANILIIGHKEHGKDTVAEILQSISNNRYSFISSSWAATKHIVYPALKGILNYDTYEECFNDRKSYRALWFELIRAYNNPAYRLAEEILEEHRVYVGMRSRHEFDGCIERGLFDLVVGVDASNRLPPEDASSNELDPINDVDMVLDNNETLAELEHEVETLYSILDEYYE